MTFNPFFQRFFPAVFCASLLSLTLVCAAFAWNDPSQNPPNDNAVPPINISSADQIKTGSISIGGGQDYWVTKDGDSFALKDDSGNFRLILGQDGNMGLGTTGPGAKLEVAGQIKITGGSPGLNKVLSSDAAGLASWKTASDLSLGLPAGAVGQTLRHNGTSWIANSIIFNDGVNVGIGTAAPGAKLEVAGQVKITGGAPGAGKVLTSNAAGLATWENPAAGSIGGSGTINYVSKFTSPTAIGDSQIFDNGTNVGIGKNNPAGKLDINAADALYILGENVLSHTAGGSTYIKAPNSQTIAFQIPSGVTVASVEATGVNAPAFYYSSDASLKKNVRAINGSLEKIKQLDGVYFSWISDGSPSMGLIAQDVEKTFPETVTVNPETGLKSVDYARLVAPLIEAVKNQQQEIETLKNEINALKNSN